MTCLSCGREKVWHGSEHRAGSEVGCHDGVAMDDDEHADGWQHDVIYPPCPHNPLRCETCSGSGDCPETIKDGSDDCPACNGTGWKDGNPQWPARRLDDGP